MGDTEMSELELDTCTLCNSPNIMFRNDKGFLCEIHYNMSQRNKMIYIAGPISNGHKASPREMYKKVKAGIKLYMQLIEKGYSPICPHFSYYAWLDHPRDIDWKTWLDMDFEYVRDSTFFFYMKPSKYGPSKGALVEYKYAKQLGKTIYTDINKVPTLKRISHALH